ncbi:MAG: hypothetical protein EA418_05435 [Wenzhouxiangellaceae bacterium]|nr:MAG: hypothetical protein EA418_05435 [Wenzhouxiangellaceae bacterium]
MTVTGSPPQAAAGIRLAALLAYPGLIALALSLERPELRALGLPLLALALVGPRPRHWPGRLLLIASLLIMVVVIQLPALALWPPGLICLAVAGYFAATLRAGSRPLIERIATLVHERQGRQVEPESLPWMRAWTAAWAMLLTLIGTTATILAALDQAGWWLAWITLAAPTLFISALIGEYLLRRRRFPDHEHWPLRRFLALLASIRPEQVAR